MRAAFRPAFVLALASFLFIVGCRGKESGQTETTTETTTQVSGTSGTPAGDTSGTAAGSASAGQPAASGATEGAAPGTMPVAPAVTPAHITVQHILIGFAGSIPGKNITRTREEARVLAYQILARARNGENFDELVRQYTDDSPPGIYKLANHGSSAAPGEYPRGQMVPAFGNVGFSLSPGNIGIADYDPATSPYGWHIIKRLL